MKKKSDEGLKNTIGLVIPRFDDMFRTYYVTETMRGVCQAASELNMDVLVHLTSKKMTSRQIDIYLGNIYSCSGIIFAEILNNETLLNAVINEKIPSVIMNSVDETLKTGCIAIDNRGGAIAAVDHLVSLGHRHIATITGDLSIQAGRERLEGYKESLKKHGIALNDDLVKKGDFSPISARKAIYEIIRSELYPTAIFVASDEMAQEAVRALTEKKIKVPQDISVIGFDNSWFATQGIVGLTTISQPISTMGEIAVKTLKKMMDAKRTAKFPRIVLPTELVKRESCVSPLKKEDFY